MLVPSPIALFLSLGSANAEEPVDTSSGFEELDTAAEAPEGTYAGGMAGCNTNPGAASALSLMGLVLIRRQASLRLVTGR